VFSGVGVLLSMAPLWISSYVFQLRVPHVSLTVDNISDFIAAHIIGNLLQMAFRFWAFRRWAFPEEFGRNPDKALESMLTDGGIADALEDVHEASNVTPLRRTPRRARGGSRQVGRRRLAGDRLSDSSEPGVSKTS
jgi:hypothetical protein